MNLPLVRLGLGTAALAGVNMVGAQVYARPSDTAVARILQCAAQWLGDPRSGRVMLDTSAQYGESEQRLGAFFNAHPTLRNRFVIATKWGLRFHPDDFARRDYSAANLRDSTARSAHQLGRIDLLYLHTNPGVTAAEVVSLLEGRDGVLDAMCEMRRRRTNGVRALGLSASTADVIERLVCEPSLLEPLDVVQLNANLLLRRPDLARALAHFDVGIVLNSPYRKGDPAKRASAAGRRSIFHDLLDAAEGALVLTGTIDPAHLNEIVGHVKAWDRAMPLSVRYRGRVTDPSVPHIEASVKELLRGAQEAAFRIDDEPEAQPPRAQRTDDTVEDVVGILVGSRRTRIGPAPDAAQRAVLCRRVSAHVQRRRPIAAFLTWAPRKFRADADDNRIDVSELAAVARLAEIHNDVSRIHAPGMRFSLFLEDFEGCYIENEQPAAFAPYLDGLDRLVAVLGLGAFIRTVHTLDLLPHDGFGQRIAARLDENYRALERYWVESQRHGIEGSERLESYAALERLGFHGVIGPDTREFYLGRLERLLGDTRSARQKREMTVRLLACVLLHRQTGIFDLRDGAEAVKLSFLPIAGGPAFLMDGRIDIRTLSTDVTKRCLTPWSSKGYLRKHRGRVLPAVKTWAEPLPGGACLAPGELHLRRGELGALVRADVLDTGAGVRPAPGTAAD
jgi:aryl-alcohol dehydrogenase-like predicted oxidoreductase